MATRQILYHLTPAKHAKAILRNGLRAGEDGYIYFFTDMIVANTVARDQVFTKRYTVFLVDGRGLESRVMQDNVAEFSRAYLRRAKQGRIAPNHLQVLNTFDTVVDHPLPWDYFLEEQLKGWTHKQTDEYWAVLRWMNEQSKAGQMPDEQITKEVNRRLKVIDGGK
jgi:hypothetical protein